MNYISLYRKYRPKCFNDVVGQDIVVKILKNSIENNQISHAYIFNGPRGTGKTSVAKIFAKAINCSNFKDDLCMKCEICSSKTEDLIDIIELDAASNNSVDDIREIVNNIRIMPTKLKYKVYIIDEVHMLSTSAFNALLKTLEEPPSHAIFILATTELYKVPTTVLSRCQKFNFKKIPEKLIYDRLINIQKEEKLDINEDIIIYISKISDGGLRDAINLYDQIVSLNNKNITINDVNNLLGNINDDIVFDLLKTIVSFNIKEMLKQIEDLFKNNINLTNFSEKLENSVKNIIIYNYTENYFDSEYEKKLDNFCKININDLINLSSQLVDLNYHLKKEYDQKNVFEIYLIKMCMLFENNDSKSIVNKIEKTNSIEETKTSRKRSVNKEKEEDNEENSTNIKNVIINNALTDANKELKINFKDKFSEVEEYISDLEFSNIVNILLKSSIEVVSNKYLIFTYNENADLLIFEKNYNLIQKLLEKIYKIKYDFVAISVEEWNSIKKEYINNIKNGKKYEYIESKTTFSKNKKSLFENNIEKLFGNDIIKNV